MCPGRCGRIDRRIRTTCHISPRLGGHRHWNHAQSSETSKSSQVHRINQVLCTTRRGRYPLGHHPPGHRATAGHRPPRATGHRGPPATAGHRPLRAIGHRGRPAAGPPGHRATAGHRPPRAVGAVGATTRRATRPPGHRDHQPPWATTRWGNRGHRGHHPPGPPGHWATGLVE